MEDNSTEIIHSSFWANLFKTPTEKIEFLNILKAIPPFAELPARDLTLLLDIIHNRSYVKGEYIFYQGDPGLGLYIIREGNVIIQRTNEESNIISLATFKKGDFFGELALIDGEKRSASAIAKTDTKLGVIFKPDLDDFIEKFPKKGVKILTGINQIIATRLRRMNEDNN